MADHVSGGSFACPRDGWKKVLLSPGEDVLRASSDWILGKMAARLVCAKCTTSSILEVAIAAMGR